MERIARLLVWLIQRFDLKTLRGIGHFLGILAYHLLSSRRKVALSNLDLAYGDEISRSEKVRIAKKSFINLVTTGLEFCYSQKINRLYPDLIYLEHVERFWQAYHRERGIILLVPHMGNWEVSVRFFKECGVQAHAVTRRQKQPWLARLVKEIRQENGVIEIDKRNALKSVVRVLREKGVVLMLIDQHARKDAVETQFFGRPAMTTASVALLAQKTGCEVIVAACFRTPEGEFGGDFSEPVDMFVTGNRDADLVRNTQTYVSAIENYVRKFPEDWMWMHRRWRPSRGAPDSGGA